MLRLGFFRPPHQRERSVVGDVRPRLRELRQDDEEPAPARDAARELAECWLVERLAVAQGAPGGLERLTGDGDLARGLPLARGRVPDHHLTRTGIEYVEIADPDWRRTGARHATQKAQDIRKGHEGARVERGVCRTLSGGWFVLVAQRVSLGWSARRGCRPAAGYDASAAVGVASGSLSLAAVAR